MNSKHGILVISHGSREQTWVETVDRTVQAAQQLWIQQAKDEQERKNRTATSVYAAYLELVEGRLIQDGVDALQSEGVTHIHVMPLFVSGGSSHVEEIRQAFGFQPISDFIGDLEPLQHKAIISFDEPIGAEPEVVQIVKQQILALSWQSESESELSVSQLRERESELSVTQLQERESELSVSQPSEQATVLLLGHGSSMPYFYEKWEAGMISIVAELRQRLPLQQISYAPLLPEGSRAALEQLLMSSERVIVIPLFISPGYFTRTIVPKRLDGLTYAYSGETLLPHPLMSELLCRRFSSYALI